MQPTRAPLSTFPLALALFLAGHGCGDTTDATDAADAPPDVALDADDDAAATPDAATPNAATPDAAPDDAAAPDAALADVGDAAAPDAALADVGPLWNDDEGEDLAEILEPIRRTARLPALAAGVFGGESMLALGAVGVRRDGDATEVTTDDVWHLGSDTKAMTATLVALLAEEGVVHFDTTLAEAFPALAATMDPAYLDVTLEQLLAHRGGTPASLLAYDDIWAALWTSADPVDEQRARFVQQVLTLPPEIEPGTAFAYSNAGYMIVGAALEATTGLTWEELMAQRIFTPLGMASCGFGPPATEGTVDQPWGHLVVEGALQPVPPGPGADNPPALGPAGTVHCAPRHWARFLREHLRGAVGQSTLLAPETFARLHTPPADGDYALGWGVGSVAWAGGELLTHDGSNSMFYASAVLAPQINRGFMVVTNRADPVATDAVLETLTVLIETYAGP